jgi:outer membrane protein assembly factor BamB
VRRSLAFLIVALAAADASAQVRSLRPLWRRDDISAFVFQAAPTGLVLAVEAKGGLVTIDAKTGRTLRRWRRPLASEQGAELLVGDHLVVSQGESVRSFDARTGKAEWRRALGCRMTFHAVARPGVIVGNCVRAPAHLYVFRDLVVALDVEAGGKELWRRKAAEQHLNEKGGLELAIGQDRVAFEDLLAGGKVQLVTLRTGDAIRTLEVRPNTSMSFGEEILLIGSAAEHVPGEALTAFDARTGVELWRRPPGAPREDAVGLPCLSSGTAWLRDGDKLLGLDARTGDERTRLPLPKEARVVRTWPAADALVMATFPHNSLVATTQVFLAGSDGRVTEVTLGVAGQVMGVAGNVLLATPIRSAPGDRGLMAFEL